MPISMENVHATIGEFQRPYLYKVKMVPPLPINVSTLKEYLKANPALDVDYFNKKAVFPDRVTNDKKVDWSGEFFYVPTTENNTKSSEFQFYDDEDNNIYDLFNALKNLTGNEYNQASVRGVQQKFNMQVYMVSVDKKTIVRSRILEGCRVYGLKYSDPSRDGSDLGVVNVTIKWDRSREDALSRGQEI
ncbi:MAG: hypothetical protein J6Y78_09790 [Paludibacteraceae bacterium]|nr:hypothetical protein [Paludibacteraceae bacterium]